MNFNKLALPALALALAAASGSVLAGDDKDEYGKTSPEMSDERPAFDEIDANADGRVTRDEAMAATGLAEEFDTLDANKDGALSRDEYGS